MLIKCPECDRDVSSSASACPNCGHPIDMDSGPFGARKRGITVRPGFWHDPNVGALALLGIVVLIGILALLAAIF